MGRTGRTIELRRERVLVTSLRYGEQRAVLNARGIESMRVEQGRGQASKWTLIERRNGEQQKTAMPVERFCEC